MFFRFSLVKKCSTAGRALMQLDFTQFMSQLNPICSITPFPHKELVEVYIKAYYLPETSLETWTKEHQVTKNLLIQDKYELLYNYFLIFNFRNIHINNY